MLALLRKGLHNRRLPLALGHVYPSWNSHCSGTVALPGVAVASWPGLACGESGTHLPSPDGKLVLQLHVERGSRQLRPSPALAWRPNPLGW